MGVRNGTHFYCTYYIGYKWLIRLIFTYYIGYEWEDRDKDEIVPIEDMTILSAAEYGSDSTHPLHHCNFMAQLSTVKQLYFKMPHLFLQCIAHYKILLKIEQRASITIPFDIAYNRTAEFYNETAY